MMDLDKIEYATECLRELERIDGMREFNATYLLTEGEVIETYPTGSVELIREITTIMRELAFGEYRQPCCNAMAVFEHIGFPIRALDQTQSLDNGTCAVETCVGRIIIG